MQQQKTENQDGMDICMITLYGDTKKTEKIEYSGAMNPLYMVSNEILEKETEQGFEKILPLMTEKSKQTYFYEVKADKRPIGGKQTEEERMFTKHSFLCKPSTETTIYLCSDGYQDQFGGQDGRKFMVKKFKDLLHEISDEIIENQEIILAKTLE